MPYTHGAMVWWQPLLGGELMTEAQRQKLANECGKKKTRKINHYNTNKNEAIMKIANDGTITESMCRLEESGTTTMNAIHIKTWKVRTTARSIVLTLNGVEYDLGASAAAIAFDLSRAVDGQNLPEVEHATT